MKRVARSPCRAEPLTATTRSGIGHHAGRADRRGQRFGQRLKAYVVGANGPPVSEKELKQLVRTKLAPFKIPREIEFVNELPHTETGKVAKAMLGDPGRASYLGNWEDDVR